MINMQTCISWDLLHRTIKIFFLSVLETLQLLQIFPSVKNGYTVTGQIIRFTRHFKVNRKKKYFFFWLVFSGVKKKKKTRLNSHFPSKN